MNMDIKKENQRVANISHNLTFDLLYAIETLTPQEQSLYDFYKNEIKQFWKKNNIDFTEQSLKQIYTLQLLSLIDYIKNHISISSDNPRPKDIISIILKKHPVPGFSPNNVNEKNYCFCLFR